MSPTQLLAHFNRLADAPDAIPRLRRFILDLAVRGKLVEQDPNDKPPQSTPSVGGVEKERPRLRGKIEPASEQPYALPKSWRWVRIGDQLELLNGMAFKPSDWVSAGIRIVRIQNLNRPDAPFNFCAPKLARERSLIDDGAFLISWSGTPGTSFGAFIWDRGPAVLNQHIFRCDFKTKAFSAEYLKLAINGRLDEMIEKAHGGVGLQHITKGKLEAMLIGLPPLAEQHRIVAKVDELMALCDRLEAARNERESRRDRLVAASLHHLSQPADDEAFRADARFTLDHLPRLTTRPEHVKQLRQTILNLAVRGRLVPQDPNDDPASELLTRIHRHRQHKRKFASIGSKSAQISTLVLPNNWTWTVVDQIAADEENAITDGPFGVQLKTEHYTLSPGYRVIRLQNIGSGIFRSEHRSYIEREQYQRLAKHHAKAGDLVVAGLVDPNVRCCELPAEIGPAVVKADCYRFSTHPSISARYAHHYLNSPLAQGFAADHHHGMTLTRIGLGNFRKLPFPLPPLAEQHRIVARVEELMALCDRLEAGLAAAEADGRRLLEAVLHEALAPAMPAFEAVA